MTSDAGCLSCACCLTMAQIRDIRMGMAILCYTRRCGKKC